MDKYSIYEKGRLEPVRDRLLQDGDVTVSDLTSLVALLLDRVDALELQMESDREERRELEERS